MGSMEIVKAIPQEVTAQQSVFLPVMTMDLALERRNSIVEFTKRIMVPDQDFGVIPGTNKPSLLKPGAEKLCNFFGLEPEFTPITEEADWTGDAHKGEMFYYVRYRCRLLRDGRVLGVGEGSCNSWESKYRWREGKRKCPSCGGEHIIKGREEYGGGWLCFAKKGGCGAKFGDKDKAILDQQVGRVPNPDIADVVNTIQKMAQKRSLVAATLIATSASEFFTQDVEDMGHVENIDTGGHALGTQAASDYVRDQKLAEARKGAQPTQTKGDETAGGSPAQNNGSPVNPVQAEAAALSEDVPVPLRPIFQNLNKQGYARQGLEAMKQKLTEALPEFGGAEYRNIVEKHGLAASGGMKIAAVKAALLEMWHIADFAEKQKALVAPVEGATSTMEMFNA